ncbi:MAG TPA: hypothetical protein VHZ09_04955 [Acidobacteriaceae bacterium]|jgi:hypothetical protein|nr:hypothetical protein [Acidobacteriaceae bacterium]
MIDTCAHVYPDGRLCRRIPKRGESLCPGHRRRSAESGDEVLERQMEAWSDHLHALPIEQIFATAVESLNVIGPVIERRFPRKHRTAFIRAAISVAVAAEMLEAVLASPAMRQPTPVLSAAEIQAKAASLDELTALLDQLGRMFPPDTSEQTP